VTPAHIETGTIDPIALDWAKKAGYKAESGSLLLIPTDEGHLGGALFGLGTNPSEQPYITGKLARALPAGDWHIETAPLTANRLSLGFGLGSYRYDRYKSEKTSAPTLMIPRDADGADIKRQLAGVFLARDLINTPTNDMGPNELEAAFRGLAAHYKAEINVVSGDDLRQNFPLVHTVGRASADAPRLLELRWGKKGHRKITLVGKGVCFDTGGRHQAGVFDAADEEGHGRRGKRHGPRLDDHGRQAQGRSQGDHSCRRKLDLVQCLPPG